MWAPIVTGLILRVNMKKKMNKRNTSIIYTKFFTRYILHIKCHILHYFLSQINVSICSCRKAAKMSSQIFFMTNLFRFSLDPIPRDIRSRALDPGSQNSVHRQNVEVTNAESTKRRTTKRRMGQNAE
jgi:hypothetical protein